MSQGCSFLLVITGHNVEAYVEPLLASLAEQTYAEWRAVFVDDASTDGTLRRLAQAANAHGLTDRITVVPNRERMYKAYNVYRVLEELARDDDVVAMVDADDRLGDPRALEILEREYRRGWDVVWSNWRGSDGSPGKSAALNPLLPASRQPFVSQHLFSFRKRLFDGVQERELQDERGEWFRAGCDAAVAWPVLDRSRRRRFVDHSLYVYTRDNPRSHKPSGGKRDQIATLALLRRRPRARAPRDWRFLADHIGYFVGSALMSARLIPRYIRHERRIREYWAGQSSIV
jgi:glycosyltransferase involved in cell wall biosynthesis